MASRKKKDLYISKNSAFDTPLSLKNNAIKSSYNTNYENNSDDDEDEDEKSSSRVEVNISRYPLKITLLGNSNVGKTSIINRYLKNTFEIGTSATIVGAFQTKKIKIDAFTEVSFEIWDTAGQETYRSLTRNYLRDSDGVIIVFDLTNEDSFKALDYWLREIKNTLSEDKVHIILVGNKSDLPNRVISEEQANQYADDHNIIYKSISAKEGINIEVIFEILGIECVKNMKEQEKSLEKIEAKKKEEDEKKNTPNNQAEAKNEKVLLSKEKGKNEKQKEKGNKKCC